ncbi:MAG: hypothetical protein J6B16_06005 [Clostridia bacterium]|nr:hypothetical protein [Clostridia bacterium]
MSKWVSVWGNAESYSVHNERIYSKNITLRYIVPIMFDGDKVKLYFSNKFTDEKVLVNSVTVGISDGSDKTTDIKTVTFNKKKSLKLKAHDSAYSDVIDYPVKKGDMLSVSIYLKNITNLSTGTGLVGKYSYGFLAEGDCTYSEVLPLYVSRDSSKNYLLYGVDVLTNDFINGLVCFGDSITAMAWPDELRSMLLESDLQVGVVRKAIGGNRVLRTYSNWLNIHYGEAGVSRVDADLDTVSGANAMVVLHGINDIIHPNGTVYRPMEALPTPEELIAGYRKYIASAKKHGLKIYFATILPFSKYYTWTPERELIRTTVNDWMRTSDEIDGVIDFDKAMRKDDDTKCAIDGYLSPDELHPSALGFKIMAEVFYKTFFNK